MKLPRLTSPSTARHPLLLTLLLLTQTVLEGDILLPQTLRLCSESPDPLRQLTLQLCPL